MYDSACHVAAAPLRGSHPGRAGAARTGYWTFRSSSSKQRVLQAGMPSSFIEP